MEKRQPIGIELVKKGVVKEADIEKALDYQKTHPNKKIGDILDILKLCDSDILINARNFRWKSNIFTRKRC